MGRVIGNGIRLYRLNLRRVFALMLLGGILVIPLSLHQMGATPSVPAQRGFFFFSHTIAWWGVVAFAVQLLFKGATIHALAASASGRSTTPRENVMAALTHLLPLFLAWVCYCIAVFIGLFLLILPGIWLGNSLVLFAIPLLMENLGPIRSLEKSHETVRGHWWRTATVLGVTTLTVIAVYFLVIAMVGAISGFDVHKFRLLAHSHALTLEGVWLLAGIALLQATLNALLQPLAYAVAVAHYQDLRLRKSRDDLEGRVRSALYDP